MTTRHDRERAAELEEDEEDEEDEKMKRNRRVSVYGEIKPWSGFGIYTWMMGGRSRER